MRTGSKAQDVATLPHGVKSPVHMATALDGRGLQVPGAVAHRHVARATLHEVRGHPHPRAREALHADRAVAKGAGGLEGGQGIAGVQGGVRECAQGVCEGGCTELRGGCAVRWCGAARLPLVLLDEACGGALHGHLVRVRVRVRVRVGVRVRVRVEAKVRVKVKDGVRVRVHALHGDGEVEHEREDGGLLLRHVLVPGEGWGE
eukprot:scaffold49407_cov39-Phaeocystis_antarctica.AAC.2